MADPRFGVQSLILLMVSLILGATVPAGAQYKPDKPPPKEPPEELYKTPPPPEPGYSPFPAVPVPGDVAEAVTSGLNKHATGVTFSWTPGNPKADPSLKLAPPDSYGICVFDGADCESSHRVQMFDEIDKSERSFSPPEGLDYGLFQGRQFHWAIKACAGMKLCSEYSEPQPMRWLLPAPVKVGVYSVEQMQPDPDKNPFMTYRFEWSRVIGAEYYFLCLHTGSITECVSEDTTRANDPFIRRRDNTSYHLDFNVPQFRGRTIRWTVSACTSRLPVNDTCTINQTGYRLAVANPLQPPIIQPLKPILDDVQSVTFRWDLPGASDIHRVHFCVTDDFPGPDQAQICEHDNQIPNIVRPANTRSCTMRRPFYGGPDPDDNPAFSFAVAACNQYGQCWWSTLARVRVEGFGPYSDSPRCD